MPKFWEVCRIIRRGKKNRNTNSLALGVAQKMAKKDIKKDNGHLDKLVINAVTKLPYVTD